MVRSCAYESFLEQMRATGRQKLDGYNPRLLQLIDTGERDEVEKLIYTTFMQKLDTDLAIFLPKLKNYDGLSALKQKLPECNIPSYNSINIAFTLWQATNDIQFLEIIMDNFNNANQSVMQLEIVGRLSNCQPDKNIYDLLVSIYINNENSTKRNTAVDGIIYNKGYIKDPLDMQEMMSKLGISRQFMLENKEDRIQMIKRLESNELIM